VSKQTVTRLFIGSVIAAVAGIIMAVIAAVLAYANGVFIMSGNDVVGIQWSTLAWVLLGLGIVASIAVMGAVIAGLVSWIGALLNTYKLESKAWFIALLLLGIFNFGVFAMIAYVVAGPDGTKQPALQPAAVPA
jgi:hypothetical protein